MTKTNYINFNSYIDRHFNINYNGKIINDVENVTFLGIKINKYLNLKWGDNYICVKLNRYVFVSIVFKQTAQIASDKIALLTYYNGNIELVLRYGLIIWGNSEEFNRALIAQK